MAELLSHGRLDIMVGSMFSGKTSALLRKLTQFAEMGLSVLYINHAFDNRRESPFSTHSPLLQDATLNISTLKTNDLKANLDVCLKFHVIGIDESQFFDETLVPFVQDLVDIHLKYVIIVGLDGDFNRKKFGFVLDLIPFADNVTKLHAYCKQCAEKSKILKNAVFTKYTELQIDTTSNVVVGGSEKYTAVCREHYCSSAARPVMSKEL